MPETAPAFPPLLTFPAGDAFCAGRLFLPDAGAPPQRLPCVVLANGFSGTMDWIVPDFAARFASAGIAAFVFDYRHLGHSPGEPRQLVDVRLQRQDLRAAIAFLRRHPAIDGERIALWGTSLGGSHVVEVAAQDPRIAAVVCNMPALDVVRGANLPAKRERAGVGRAAMAWATLRLLRAALHDAVLGAYGTRARYLPVYGPPGRAFFTDPTLAERFRTVQQQSPTWENRVAARFLLQAPRYRAGTLERIRAPVLFTLADQDVEVSGTFIRRITLGLPNCTVREYAGGHFDLYHGDTFARVAADQAAFLRQALLGKEGPA
jgi:hypothetical protein